jgi:small-conductance mechanosensitive channel
MNELLNFRFSEFSILTVLFSGLLLSLLMRLMRRFVLHRIVKNKIRQWFQIAELVVWMLYGAWALHNILGDSIYYQLTILLILLVIIIWVSWFAVRDFIAGLVLNLNDSFQPGQYFKIQEIEGTIRDIDYLQIHVRQENGTIIKIPYNKISGAIHSRGAIEDQGMKHRFKVEVAAHYSEEEIRTKIRTAIFQTAGARIKTEPSIISKGEENKKQQYEIQVSILSPDYNKLIEANVIESLK